MACGIRYIGRTGTCVNKKFAENKKNLIIFVCPITIKRKMSEKEFYCGPFGLGKCISISSITLDRQEKAISDVSQLFLPFLQSPSLSLVLDVHVSGLHFSFLFVTAGCTRFSLENTQASGKCFYMTVVRCITLRLSVVRGLNL